MKQKSDSLKKSSTWRDTERLTKIKKLKKMENQDGGVGRHTAPPRTTRTDRKSNGKEVRHQVDKK